MISPLRTSPFGHKRFLYSDPPTRIGIDHGSLRRRIVLSRSALTAPLPGLIPQEFVVVVAEKLGIRLKSVLVTGPEADLGIHLRI